MLSLLLLQSHPPQLCMLPGTLQQGNNPIHRKHRWTLFCYVQVVSAVTTGQHVILTVFSDLHTTLREYERQQ